jgi:hypothetical protein
MCTVLLPPGVNPIAVNKYIISKTEQEWLAVAKQYQALWNFPHSVRTIDGKHVVLQCPRNSASEYF